METQKKTCNNPVEFITNCLSFVFDYIEHYCNCNKQIPWGIREREKMLFEEKEGEEVVGEEGERQKSPN